MTMGEWKECTLGDVLNFRRGHDLPKSKINSGKIPVAGSNGIIGWHNASTPIKPIITIGRSGSIGHPFIYEQAWAHNTTLYIDDFKGNHPKYLYYLLFSLPLSQWQAGSAVPTLNRNHIHPLPIKFPNSLIEQKKIAAILSSLDEKIETNRKICASLEELAQALFKSWFIDFEPFGRKKPEDWKNGILSDIANIIMGQSPAGEYINTNRDGLVFYQGKTEFQERFPLIKNYTTSITRIAPIDSILLSVRAPVGAINITLNECCIGRGIAALNHKDGANSFLYLLLKNSTQYFDIFDKGGTVFGSINKKSLEEMPITIPNKLVIEAFNHKIKPIDKEIERRTIESTLLAELRDTLLPKLMSGEIKVDNFVR